MKIQTLSFYSYEIPFIDGRIRHGIYVHMVDEQGRSSWGEIASLPMWSQETLPDCWQQLSQKRQDIMQIIWTEANVLKELKKLDLFPSVSFGLESALLSILSPLPEHCIAVSALLMGSPLQILEQANLRYQEGYTSAKLKVGHLNFEEAFSVIHALKDKFRLRIDVNRAWKTESALAFFKQFSLDTFDYVEEPFHDPADLGKFLHPLAVDESFPKTLSLKQLNTLPTLKAIIYKPTIQGGLSNCLSLRNWVAKKKIEFILSSSFESELGLSHIVSMAYRLSVDRPIGIGTYHYLRKPVCTPSLRLTNSFAYISEQMEPLKLFLKDPVFLKSF